jgi:hypothetical protein
METELQHVDIGFLIDTTCSMGSTRTALATEFGEIVAEVSASITTAQYGYATFDDYVYWGMASAEHGDHPFTLRQQVTNDLDAVQANLSATPDDHYGADLPESTMEALFQAASGTGFDQNCDGEYDATTDILPFLSSEADLFGGDGGEAWDDATTGGGSTGGLGFRDEILPVLIYATDAYMRDPEGGYGTPAACSNPAGFSDVVAATADIGARLIGVASEDTDPIGQMNTLAAATSSSYDSDGDAEADTPLVFHWADSSSDFRHTVVEAIEWLLGGVHFDSVELEVDSDPWEFITDVTPESYDDIMIGVSGETLSFTITLDGSVPAMADDVIYMVTLNVYGDATTLLASEPLIIVVPGTSP